jgi:predicted amidohydrolase
MRARIGIVEFRADIADKDKNIHKGLEIIDQAANQSVDILVFPELWTTGYLAGSKFPSLAEKIPGPTTELLASSSSKHGIFLVGGSIPEISNRKIRNTLFVADRTGKVIAKHRKAHLWESYEKKYFVPGDKCTVVDTEFGKLGFGICYDGDFQEYSRVLALRGARVFFNPSAYASPGEDDWRMFHPCFARQNGFYVVCTNLVGHESGELTSNIYPDGQDFFGESRIIDPFGHTVIQSDPLRRETALYVADVDLSLVEKVRGGSYFNLYKRRPELYKSLLSKPHPTVPA